MFKERAAEEMKRIFNDIPFGIDHTLKVLKNAEDIMEGEDVPASDRELISIAAILHDIGAVEAQRKYGSMDASYQEKEGPIVARDVLKKIGYDPIKSERVCFIIGHHHTPSRIDGLDFLIQWEADLLENLEAMEIRSDKQKLEEMIDRNFKTGTGKFLALDRFRKELEG